MGKLEKTLYWIGASFIGTVSVLSLPFIVGHYIVYEPYGITTEITFLSAMFEWLAGLFILAILSIVFQLIILASKEVYSTIVNKIDTQDEE